MAQVRGPRRSTLAVPGSSPRMLDKARGLPADEVFLDLEDAVAPSAKAQARRNIVLALNEGGYQAKVRAVRVNDWATAWTYTDVIEVVTGAGAELDCIILPKVQTGQHLVALDLLLSQVERSVGLEVGRIGIEAQIEDALGLINVDAIAQASTRLETLIFGPADFMASIAMKSLIVGEQPAGYDTGDAYHYVLMRILMAARAYDRQAIDGPYLAIGDLDGFRRVAGRSAALGFDGKWVVHPDQIATANEVYSPDQADFDRAELILDAYAYSTSVEGGATGAVRLGGEMIDEASRKMALVISAKGRAAGMTRTQDIEIRCVGAVVFDREGRLLLIRRAQPPAQGTWSLPGGRVEAGESDEAAVLRELAEETGLAGTVGRHVGDARRAGPDGQVYLIRDYLVTVEDTGPTRAGDDASAAGWFRVAEVRALETSPDLVATLDGWGLLGG